jgi:ADP-ribose pyrophosphatase YjhB (NUDIX family)
LPEPLFCPRCGVKSLHPIGEKKWRCKNCGFVFFHNTASSVVGIIEHQGKILVTERGVEPAAGTLDLPGGFVDNRETLEDALAREIKEELDLEIEQVKYLGSCWNEYPYRGVTYWTVDAFFTCRPCVLDAIHAREEITRWFWMDVSRINPADFGFASIQNGLAIYLKHKQS